MKHAAINSLAATAYIALVATVMSNIKRFIGPNEGDGNVLSLIAFLTLFVISAATMGIIIFGRPIMWYLNGEKSEAVKLTLYTVGFMIIIAATIFTCLFYRASTGT
ncbi:MAG: hypothetical protein AAB594_00050 [Patescibacteria group bacterium]